MTRGMFGGNAIITPLQGLDNYPSIYIDGLHPSLGI